MLCFVRDGRHSMQELQPPIAIAASRAVGRKSSGASARPSHFRILQRRARIRPGLRVRRGDLSAVRERRFERRAGLAVDDGDLVSVRGEVPRGGDADDPRAEYDDAHVAR